jgi:DNA polymerase-3 subunit delta
VLIFGPDAGLVRERAEALVRASVDDPGDPFQLARLDGDDLAGEPTRSGRGGPIPFRCSAGAVPSGLKPAGRNFAHAVEALVASASRTCRVIIEAGDLRRNAPFACDLRAREKCRGPPLLRRRRTGLVRLIDDEMR